MVRRPTGPDKIRGTDGLHPGDPVAAASAPAELHAPATVSRCKGKDAMHSAVIAPSCGNTARHHAIVAPVTVYNHGRAPVTDRPRFARAG